MFETLVIVSLCFTLCFHLFRATYRISYFYSNTADFVDLFIESSLRHDIARWSMSRSPICIDDLWEIIHSTQSMQDHLGINHIAYKISKRSMTSWMTLHNCMQWVSIAELKNASMDASVYVHAAKCVSPSCQMHLSWSMPDGSSWKHAHLNPNVLYPDGSMRDIPRSRPCMHLPIPAVCRTCATYIRVF